MVEARTRAMVGLAPKTDVARRRQRMPCYLPPPAVTRALELSQRQACAGRAGGRWADEALRPRQRPARPGTGPSFGHGPFCEAGCSLIKRWDCFFSPFAFEPLDVASKKNSNFQT